MATGATAYLIIKNIPECDWSFPIDKEKKIIGRSQAADIRLPSRFQHVSRRHAEVWCDHRGVWIHDLGSMSGTNINGVWVDHVPQAGLAIGDAIWLGRAELEVVGEIDELADFTPENTDAAPTNLSPKISISMSRRLARRLSPAEIDVMLWLSRGYQENAEIGKFLHRSPHTVRTEINSIFRKLGLHSRAELMGWLKRANHQQPGAVRPPK